MSARQLILLSPYRLPTHTTLYLGDDEVAAFLNAWAVLWHPAALHGADGLPRLASPYDHEQPSAGHVYAVPDQPPLMLPDDWGQRVREAGAVVFQATADRQQTLGNLQAALLSLPPVADASGSVEAPVAGTPGAVTPDQVAPFYGIGFGLLLVDALFDAMSHDNAIATAELWQDVRAAVAALGGPEPEAFRQHLQAAADRLLSAREVVYPPTIHLMDLLLADPQRLDTPWPGAAGQNLPWNLLACASWIERLAGEQPARLAQLRERFADERMEVIGGPYQEREDPLLSLESQLWNLLHGQAVYREHLGREVRVFGRRRSGFHPNLPLLLHHSGLSRALLVSFDEAVMPSYRTPLVSWPSPDGKHVESFTRTPLPVDSPQTFFHLAHHLHETIMHDQAATLALVHKGKPASPWYDDWVQLTRFAPVLGRWTTFSGFFNEVLTGDYASAAAPDEFHADYLAERTGSSGPGDGPGVAPPPAVAHPVSAFAAQARGRRHVDTAYTLAALLRALGERVPDHDGQPFETWLARLEDRFESNETFSLEELIAAQNHAAAALARRLCARGQENNPGFLALNPCSFTRRVVLELPGLSAPLPVGGPIKACQLEGTTARVVLEVPGLGFAWIPRGPAGPLPPPPARMRLADESSNVRCVRNEFLEAEVDLQTGGLKALRDQKSRVGRLGQQLVFNPGSTMRCQQVQTTSTGPALGEIITTGTLNDEQGEPLAHFRQRFRAWLGRPVLELRIEITPIKPPEGYPWHSYYGARFAWRDEKSTLLRGSQGTASMTSHTRPETPDFLEIRQGRQNAVIFPGGLPFHQRHSGRMVDVILVPANESEHVFDLSIGLDRETPMQTALGVVSPVAVVPVDRGPPHVGASGWLFHLDSPNLLLTSLRPLPPADPEAPAAVMARLLECSAYGGQATLRCVRDPVRAGVVDARNELQFEAATEGDAVQVDVGSGDLVHLRIEFR
jgi:hypothetical protein